LSSPTHQHVFSACPHEDNITGTCLKPPTMKSAGSQHTIAHPCNKLGYYGGQEPNRNDQLCIATSLLLEGEGILTFCISVFQIIYSAKLCNLYS